MTDESLSFQERVGRNEIRFRDVNEGIRSGRQGQETPVGFVCECGAADCATVIQVLLPAYEAVRGDARRFVIAPGHDYPETETVVERHDTYWVIEKFDRGAEVAEASDPRR